MPKGTRLSLDDLMVQSFVTSFDLENIRAGEDPAPVKKTDVADVNCSGNSNCTGKPGGCPCGTIGPGCPPIEIF